MSKNLMKPPAMKDKFHEFYISCDYTKLEFEVFGNVSSPGVSNSALMVTESFISLTFFEFVRKFHL